MKFGDLNQRIPLLQVSRRLITLKMVDARKISKMFFIVYTTPHDKVVIN